MNYVIPPAAVVSLPITGSDQRFPVRRIYCVGRNYAEHAREMGHDPDRELPFFFQKMISLFDFSGFLFTLNFIHQITPHFFKRFFKIFNIFLFQFFFHSLRPARSHTKMGIRKNFILKFYQSFISFAFYLILKLISISFRFFHHLRLFVD